MSIKTDKTGGVMNRKKVLLVVAICLSVIVGSVYAREGIKTVITNRTLVTADTEYSVDVTGGLKVMIQTRENVEVRMAYVSGRVATPTGAYWTIKANQIIWDDNVAFNGTLYFATDDAGSIVEVIVWK